MSAPKKLVLFDLDGVLIDSKRNMEFSWNKVKSQLHLNVEFDEYFKLIGRSFFDIMKILGLSDQHNEIEKIFRATSASNVDLIDFYPGVIEILSLLQSNDIKIGVVTSKDRLRTDGILSMLPFRFHTVQTPKKCYRSKPAPDHLLLSMAISGVDPSDSLYIGDMSVDMQSAERAGIDYLHASWGYEDISSSDVQCIESIRDIINYLK